MNEPQKSEVEFREKFSSLMKKYSPRISKIRLKQFLAEALEGVDKFNTEK